MSKAKAIKELAKRAKSGVDDLAMDFTSRMARAKEMGFDTSKTYYHGASDDIDAFRETVSGKAGKGGVYFTDSPDRASKYANMSAKFGGNSGRGDVPNVTPVNLKMKNPYISETGMPYNENIQSLQNAGYDGIILKGEMPDGGDEVISFDPSNIRSVNAAFDPAKKASSNLLASTVPAAVGLGALGQSEDSEASFLGQAAKNADKMMLNIAQKMEKSGISPDEIWQKTGWGKGVDDKWRFEISDEAFSLDPSKPQASEFGFKTATGDVLKHGELRNNYPDLFENMKVSFEPNLDSQGSYSSISASKLLDAPQEHFIRLKDPAKARMNVSEQMKSWVDKIGEWSKPGYAEKIAKEYDIPLSQAKEEVADDISYLTDNLRKAKEYKGEIEFYRGTESTALHETQHGIQNIEGFARGGSPALFMDDMQALAELNDMNFADMDDFQRASYRELKEKYPDVSDPHTLYKRLAGETEARNVQTRMNMTPTERRAKAPWLTEDVPRSQQIVRYGAAGAAPMAALYTPEQNKAYASQQTPQFIDRVNNPENYPVIGNDDGSISTHRMAVEVDERGNWAAFPTIVQMPNGRLKQFEDPFEAMEYNRAIGNTIEFGPDKQGAIDYGNNYKPESLKNYKPKPEQYQRPLSVGRDGVYMRPEDYLGTAAGIPIAALETVGTLANLIGSNLDVYSGNMYNYGDKFSKPFNEGARTLRDLVKEKGASDTSINVGGYLSPL